MMESTSCGNRSMVRPPRIRESTHNNNRFSSFESAFPPTIFFFIIQIQGLRQKIQTMETSSPILRLPQDVLSLIPNYLLEKEEQNQMIFEFSWDWRNFMNTSKQYRQWKKQSRFVVLSTQYSMKFLKMQPFRNQVLNLFENSALQLSMSLIIFDRLESTDLRGLPNLKKLDIHGSHLNTIHFPEENVFDELYFHCCGQFPALRKFENVRKLVLSRSSWKYETVNLACLVNVVELELYLMVIKGYHLLPKLKKLLSILVTVSRICVASVTCPPYHFRTWTIFGM
jgi:hypothetical protein